MHWLIANLYLILWACVPVFLIYRLVRLVSQSIIVKGEFSRIVLYAFTLAALAAFMTPQFDEIAHYCMKLLLLGGLAGVVYVRFVMKR